MSKPTAMELTEQAQIRCLGVADPIFMLAARVEAVLALHDCMDDYADCVACRQPWPCPTVRVLNGEKP